MEWIGAAVLLPMLLCAGMFVAGAVIAVFGLRKETDTARQQHHERLDEPWETTGSRW